MKTPAPGRRADLALAGVLSACLAFGPSACAIAPGGGPSRSATDASVGDRGTDDDDGSTATLPDGAVASDTAGPAGLRDAGVPGVPGTPSPHVCGAYDASPRQPARHAADADAAACGDWALVDGVCCARYCSNDNTSDSCASCGGPASANCVAVNSKACVSGQWPEVHELCGDEPWHYSRSTHFGLTYAGACGFGLYGLCTTKFTFTDPSLQAQCSAFCTEHPALCADPPDGGTLRGNFAAPNGNYYTQFWPSLPGADDNYLSCGECFEVVRTEDDGSDVDQAKADSGYTPPVVLQIVDSCPCSANAKWCCGSGRDHCGEVGGKFKYGCQLPPAPPSPDPARDPLPGESIHLDLSDIAMARLQTGDANGGTVAGVIPTRYRRVPCPVTGNIHMWLRSGASKYWFALSIVNVAGLGSVVSVDVQGAGGSWISLQRDPNYTAARPQERSGGWVLPQRAQVDAPVTLRVTDPSGRSVLATNAIPSWDLDAGEWNYVDLGVQF